MKQTVAVNIEADKLPPGMRLGFSFWIDPVGGNYEIRQVSNNTVVWTNPAQDGMDKIIATDIYRGLLEGRYTVEDGRVVPATVRQTEHMRWCWNDDLERWEAALEGDYMLVVGEDATIRHDYWAVLQAVEGEGDGQYEELERHEGYRSMFAAMDVAEEDYVNR